MRRCHVVGQPLNDDDDDDGREVKIGIQIQSLTVARAVVVDFCPARPKKAQLVFRGYLDIHSSSLALALIMAAAASSSHDESDQSLYHETPVFRAFEQASLGQPSNFALSSTSLEASSSRPGAPRQAGLTTSSKTLVETRSGRSPWYGLNGLPSEAYVIGVAGGSASGKTSVASRVLTKLNVPTVAVVSQDSFYKPLNPEQVSIC